MSFNNKKLKGIGLSRGTRKNKIFEYSPSIEIEKQSRDNSTKRNNINDIQNEKISNISVININRSGLEEPDDNFNKKRIEEIAYDKYINNYGKNLTIVKNNTFLSAGKAHCKVCNIFSSPFKALIKRKTRETLNTLITLNN